MHIEIYLKLWVAPSHLFKTLFLKQPKVPKSLKVNHGILLVLRHYLCQILQYLMF